MEPSSSSGIRTALRGRGDLLRGAIVLLLAVGCGLVYATLFRRWGYHEIAPQDLPHLLPEDIASATVYWWDATNNCCGPFPAIWPGLALLSALPLCVAAVKRREGSRLWARFALLFVILGVATMVVDVNWFLLRGSLSDSGWAYKTDNVTMVMGYGGYALTFLSVLALWGMAVSPRAKRRAPDPTTRIG